MVSVFSLLQAEQCAQQPASLPKFDGRRWKSQWNGNRTEFVSCGTSQIQIFFRRMKSPAFWRDVEIYRLRIVFRLLKSWSSARSRFIQFHVKCCIIFWPKLPRGKAFVRLWRKMQGLCEKSLLNPWFIPIISMVAPSPWLRNSMFWSLRRLALRFKLVTEGSFCQRQRWCPVSVAVLKPEPFTAIPVTRVTRV